MFKKQPPLAAYESKLYNQTTFYNPFTADIQRTKETLLIESPFIRLKRVTALMPLFRELRSKNVKVVVNTRDPGEHEPNFQRQAEEAILLLQDIGVQVLFTVRHHRKLAIIDGSIVWEGSLNILSFYDSCEIMRRIASKKEAETLIDFIQLREYLSHAE